MVPPANALPFKRRLLHWFRRHGRRLPWRTTRDPYRILVSEFMLQQTQVHRVTPYYDRFLARYPRLADLARAPVAAVREAWEGLGYYHRATNLKRLAQAVVKRGGGALPDRPDALRQLPGVGPYTAAAVAAFAYQRRVLPMDTNVTRVLRRAFGFRMEPGARGRRKLDMLAASLLPRRNRVAWEFNQAMMDLGAMICTARAPRCPSCRVRVSCKTGRSGYNAETA